MLFSIAIFFPMNFPPLYFLYQELTTSIFAIVITTITNIPLLEFVSRKTISVMTLQEGTLVCTIKSMLSYESLRFDFKKRTTTFI